MSKEPDYYTVMEPSIRYYAKKYDPDNLLQKSVHVKRTINHTEVKYDSGEVVFKKEKKKKSLAALFYF